MSVPTTPPFGSGGAILWFSAVWRWPPLPWDCPASATWSNFAPRRRASPSRGEEGRWLPFPVEYKRGRPKPHQADELQLCAQAMCLEEMLCCPVPEGALYYGETRRRTPVRFSPELRRQVQSAAEEMHQLFRRGHTPKARPGKFCGACSLKELCLPQLIRRESVSDYLNRAMEETP